MRSLQTYNYVYNHEQAYRSGGFGYSKERR